MTSKKIFHIAKVTAYVLTIVSMMMAYTVVDVPRSTAVVTTGSITGRITSGGEPVGAGDVGVSTNPYSGSYANTEADGTFTITGITPGTYRLETNINDEESYPDYMASIKNGVVVTTGNTTDIGDWPLALATKTITGRVYYKSSNAGVSGVRIDAWQFNGIGNAETVTNSQGVYTLKVTGGQWGLSISTSDPDNQDWVYSGMPQDQTFAKDTTVESRTVNYGVMLANSYVTGKIVDPNGAPKVELNLNLFSQNSGGAWGQTDANGNFSIRTAAGIFDFQANFPSEEQMYSLPPQKIEVLANQTKNLGTIQIVQKTSKFQGTVRNANGTPVEGISVNAFTMGSSGPGEFAYDMTDANGNYSLYVNPGYYGLDVYVPEDLDWVSAGTTKEYSIGDNQTINNVNFGLIKADVTINGRVVNAHNELQTDFFSYADVTDASKEFSMGPMTYYGAPIMNGEFQVKFPSSVMTNIQINAFIDNTVPYSLKEQKKLTVSPNSTYNVTLELVPNDAVLTGVVKDNKGNVVSGFDFGEVFVMGTGGTWRNTFVQQNGSYTLSLKSGKYDGRGVNLQGGNYMQTPPDFNQDGIYVKSGTTVWNPVVYKADSKINVTLKDPDGKLLSGHGFVFAHEDIEEQPGMTFKNMMETGAEIFNGTGTIDVVGGKTYLVGAPPPPQYESENWMPPEEVAVTAAANGTSNVTLQYKKADGTITGTITFEDGSAARFGYVGAWSEDGANSGAQVFSRSYSLPVTKNSTWHVNADTFTGVDYYTSGETVIRTPDETGFTIEKNFVVTKSDFVLPKPVCSTWDSTQPKQINLSDGTKLVFPATSLATSGNVTVCAQPTVNLKPEKNKKPAKGFGYSLTATDANSKEIATFNSAVTVSMKVDADKLEELGITYEDILPAFFNVTTNKWDTVTNASYDAENDLLTFTTTHFTDYAIVTGVTATGGVTASDIIATPASAGGPQVTIWDSSGTALLNFLAFPSYLRFGIQAKSGDFNGDGTSEIAVVPETGGGPQVRIFDRQGQLIDQFLAYAGHIRSGVNLAVADLDGDGSDEIITATMAGAGPQIRVFNGRGDVLSQFWAYAETFRGGVELATGDVDSDGLPEIITVPMSAGGPQVRVFDYDGSVVTQFTAFPEWIRGGYQLAISDVDGDSDADITVVPKAGNGPQIVMFDGQGNRLGQFMAFAPTFRGGVNVSVNDLDGDGINEIVATTYSLGGPQVRVFNARGDVLSQFVAYAPFLRGGFTTSLLDVNDDGIREIVTAPGAGMGPQARVFNYAGEPLSQFFTHTLGFRGGISINGIPSL